MMPSVYTWAEDGATLTVHIWAGLLECLDKGGAAALVSAALSRCYQLFGFNCSLRLTCGSFFPAFPHFQFLSFILTVDFAASSFLQARIELYNFLASNI